MALLPAALSCGLSGCAVFSAYNASPFPHDYDKGMDEGSVRWLARKPTIDLARYGDQSFRPHQRLRDVDFVLSVSGGGQRAAALALGTMLALEQDLGVGAGNALLEVDAISIGLTASSSIPPGRHVSLELGLCDAGSAHPLRDTHLCASGRRYLHLIDGGFIDNLGYRTAVEALRTGPAARNRKVLLVVDSSADDHVPLSDDADPSTLITLGGAVKNIGNGAYAAFHQLAEKWASLNGVELVVLGAAQLVESIGQTLPASDPRMAGLSTLRRHQDPELGAICVNGQCDILKIYALIKKTAASYSIEDDTQRLLIDIGRLLARARAEEICAALTGTAPRPGLADASGRLRCLL